MITEKFCLTALVNKKSGDYYNEEKDEYVCIAVCEGKPVVIGGYQGQLNKKERLRASKIIWGEFIRHAC